MSNAQGANRIELECQVLSAALRCSWAGNDSSGRVKSCSELSQLFPDLIPNFGSDQSQKPRNSYEVLGLDCDVSPRKVVVAYFRAAKKFLYENNPRQKRLDYYQILDAGFLLRKPRLRLSHDLTVSRADLVAKKLIRADGTYDVAEPMTEFGDHSVDRPVNQSAAQPVNQSAVQPVHQSVGQPVNQSVGQPLNQGGNRLVEPPQTPVAPPPPVVQKRLPALVELLRASQIISAAEVQALVNQMKSFPGVPIADLILSAGYVSEGEMQSVLLGEFLLGQGKIDLGKFCVAMYDERTTGVKMAESLQARGWL